MQMDAMKILHSLVSLALCWVQLVQAEDSFKTLTIHPFGIEELLSVRGLK